MDKKTFKKIVYLIAATALFAVIVIKIDPVAAFLLKTMSPLFVGIAIAFILNKPYCFIRKLYLKKAQKKRTYALMSGLAVVSVYILFLGIITGIVAFIIPQLVESVSTLISNMDNCSGSDASLSLAVLIPRSRTGSPFHDSKNNWHAASYISSSLSVGFESCL